MERKNNQWVVPGISDHPLREQLTNEIHARPSPALHTPARLSHLALASGEPKTGEDRDHVAALCRRFSAAVPPPDAKYWHVNLGVFHLNWERHTEFSTYTFIREGAFSEPFREPVITLVPHDWLKDLAGDILVAIHVAIETDAMPQRTPEQLAELFISDNIAGSQVASGAAQVWTDFRLHSDGFSRILIRDSQLGLRQTGRLVQRLLDIETYRMMALLAFPIAQDYSGKVTNADQTLSDLTQQMLQNTDPDDERQLFDKLSRLAAEVERLAATSNYRFSAARAYYALVQRRIAELREERTERRPTIREFMERRLAPAMRTCESVHERLDVLSRRVARAGNLLRTRVDLALEKQSRDLLDSMNRRAHLQLRLQQTVEGLSVVVLSYYLIGLLSYGAKALKATGLSIDSDLLLGVAIPIVIGAVWLGMRRLHHRLNKEHDQDH